MKYPVWQQFAHASTWGCSSFDSAIPERDGSHVWSALRSCSRGAADRSLAQCKRPGREWGNTGHIYKYSASGTRTTFASGLGYVSYLALPVLDTNAFCVLSINPQGEDVSVEWALVCGGTNALQASGGDVNGNYSTNGFGDICIVTNISITGTVTNFVDAGALTNGQSRYYRARWSH